MNPQQRLEHFLNSHDLKTRDLVEKRLSDPIFCREIQNLFEECIGVREKGVDDLEV